MSAATLPKLVRDLVPHIMREGGRYPLTHTADPGEFADRLLDKLAEETGELREAGTDEARLGELADVLEVVYALADTLPGGREALHAARESKLAERGGFGLRLVWDGDAPGLADLVMARQAPRPLDPCVIRFQRRGDQIWADFYDADGDQCGTTYHLGDRSVAWLIAHYEERGWAVSGSEGATAGGAR